MIRTFCRGVATTAFIVTVAAAVFVLLCCMMGCSPAGNAAAVVAPTGTDIQMAAANTDSAERAVQAAVPHSDVAGKADLGLASSAHKAVKSNLSQAQSDLAAVQATIAANEAKITKLTAQVTVLLNSWGHKLQVFVEWAFWVLIGLVALHIVAGLCAILFPTIAPIAGLVAKIVNPLGWTTWAIARFGAAAAPTATSVIPLLPGAK